MKKLGAHPGFMGYLIVNADGIPIRRCVCMLTCVRAALSCLWLPAAVSPRAVLAARPASASASPFGSWSAARKTASRVLAPAPAPTPARWTTRRQCSTRGLSASCATRHALLCGSLTPLMMSPSSVFDQTSTRFLSPQVSSSTTPPPGTGATESQ